MTKVVLFCGGRGSATIIKSLLEWPDIELTLVVNAYDDGKSTGALRLFIPGMLGPSDFRKNISYLLDLAIPENQVLKEMLEVRFRDGATVDDVDDFWVHCKRSLSPTLYHHLSGLLDSFIEYAEDRFDYSDCSFGNIIFAGAYLKAGGFNQAVELLSELFGLRARLLNVSKGECCTLQALKADGTVLLNEAAIVGDQSDVPIFRTYLVSNPVTAAELDDYFLARHTLLRERQAEVQLSPEAEEAILAADMIVYGPGTQHSSLLPSYRIARDALRNATAAVKAMVVNLEHDHDIQQLTASNLVDKAMTSGAQITHVLFNLPEGEPRMPVGDLRANYQGAEVISGRFESQDNPAVHDGKAVVDMLKQLVTPVTLRGYDLDGVLTEGVVPKYPYVVISGRTFNEHLLRFSPGTDHALGVYIRGSGKYGDHQASGEFKAMMINHLGVTEFHEDRPEQTAIIRERCPSCVVVSHDVGRPRTDAR